MSLLDILFQVSECTVSAAHKSVIKTLKTKSELQLTSRVKIKTNSDVTILQDN